MDSDSQTRLWKGAVNTMFLCCCAYNANAGQSNPTVSTTWVFASSSLGDACRLRSSETDCGLQAVFLGTSQDSQEPGLSSSERASATSKAPASETPPGIVRRISVNQNHVLHIHCTQRSRGRMFEREQCSEKLHKAVFVQQAEMRRIRLKPRRGDCAPGVNQPARVLHSASPTIQIDRHEFMYTTSNPK